MKEKRYFVAFDDQERRIMANCPKEIRTRLKRESRYTDAVDELILRICDAPTKKFKGESAKKQALPLCVIEVDIFTFIR